MTFPQAKRICPDENAPRADRPTPPGRPERRSRDGFTLLEVIVACTIFFIFAFAVLEMTTRSLAAVRVIQQREPDAGLVASMVFLEEKLEEQPESGDFEDIYPGMYRDWHWAYQAEEVASNGLFRVTIVIYRQSAKGPASTEMEMLLYRPLSPPGSASSGGVFR